MSDQPAVDGLIRHLAEHIDRGLVLQDCASGRILYVNRAWEIVFGLSRARLLHDHRALWEVVHQEDRPRLMDLQNGLTGTGTEFGDDFRLVRPDGRTVWVNLRGRPARGWDELPALVTLVAEDVTARREKEAAMQADVERLRTIAEFTYDWEYWRGPNDTLLWVSPSCERLTGYLPWEFHDQPNLHLDIIHPDDRPVIEAFFRQEGQTDKYYHLDFRIVRRDGETRWISYNDRPVYGPDGSWWGRRVSNRDVTGRRETEERLLAYQRELRSLAAALSLAEDRERRSIAVDLHDRVGHTLAMCQIKLNQFQMNLARPDLAPALDEVEKLLEEAIFDVRHLILEISPPALYELGLGAALDELAQQIQDEYGLKIEFTDSGRALTLSEELRVAVYRSARELIFNAVKHAQATNVLVSLQKGSRYLRLEVIDDGVGFVVDQKQPDRPSAKSYGLFSIRERIHHLGGQVRITSQPGRGTRVAVTVPWEREG